MQFILFLCLYLFIFLAEFAKHGCWYVMTIVIIDHRL